MELIADVRSLLDQMQKIRWEVFRVWRSETQAHFSCSYFGQSTGLVQQILPSKRENKHMWSCFDRVYVPHRHTLCSVDIMLRFCCSNIFLSYVLKHRTWCFNIYIYRESPPTAISQPIQVVEPWGSVIASSGDLSRFIVVTVDVLTQESDLFHAFLAQLSHLFLMHV
jgi:hypothetical protein